MFYQSRIESKIEALKPESRVLEDVIERSNDLLQEKVKNPLEALLDLRLMSAAAELGAEKLAKLPIGVQDLNVGTFMDRFLGFFRGRSDDLGKDISVIDGDANQDSVPVIDWLSFGIDFYGQVARTSPSMGFL